MLQTKKLRYQEIRKAPVWFHDVRLKHVFLNFQEKQMVFFDFFGHQSFLFSLLLLLNLVCMWRTQSVIMLFVSTGHWQPIVGCYLQEVDQ